MLEVSSVAAAKIIGISDDTIRRQVRNGLLSARQQGLRGMIRIEIEELRSFAQKYQYRFDENLASQLAEN